MHAALPIQLFCKANVNQIKDENDGDPSMSAWIAAYRK